MARMVTSFPLSPDAMMVQPNPESAATRLWNSLIQVGGDDRPELDRINRQLEFLAARQRGDFLTRLAAGTGLLWAGATEAAAPHVEAAYGLHPGQPFSSIHNLMELLVQYGDLGKARLLASKLLADRQAAGDEILDATATRLAFRSADSDLLRQVAAATRLPHGQGSTTLRLMAEANLLSWFPAHMAALEEIVAPVVCGFETMLIDDETGQTSFMLRYRTRTDAPHRMALMRRISESLQRAYGNHPSGNGAYLETLVTMISGVRVPPVEMAN